MSNVQTALDRYTRAENARKDFIQANKSVFDAHEALAMSCIDTDNELRDAVAETKESISNDEYVVTVTPQSQTFADIEAIDALIAGGVIPASKRAEIVKTVDRPSKVIIRPQK